jgi:glucosamine-6-phosphate deaminase
MVRSVNTEELYQWCRIPFDQMQTHPDIRIPFRLTDDSASMGMLMARELADEIVAQASFQSNMRFLMTAIIKSIQAVEPLVL